MTTSDRRRRSARRLAFFEAVIGWGSMIAFLLAGTLLVNAWIFGLKLP